MRATTVIASACVAIQGKRFNFGMVPLDRHAPSGGSR